MSGSPVQGIGHDVLGTHLGFFPLVFAIGVLTALEPRLEVFLLSGGDPGDADVEGVMRSMERENPIWTGPWTRPACLSRLPVVMTAPNMRTSKKLRHIHSWADLWSCAEPAV